MVIFLSSLTHLVYSTVRTGTPFLVNSWSVYCSVRVETLQFLLLCHGIFPLMVHPGPFLYHPAL